LEKLYNDYKEKAQFFLVYVREAHPVENARRNKGADPNRGGPQVAAAKTVEDRVIAATNCVRELKLSIPVLIDDMQGSTEKTYRGWPARLVIVDVNGNVSYCTPSSPGGANPKEAIPALQRIVGNGEK